MSPTTTLSMTIGLGLAALCVLWIVVTAAFDIEYSRKDDAAAVVGAIGVALFLISLAAVIFTPDMG